MSWVGERGEHIALPRERLKSDELQSIAAPHGERPLSMEGFTEDGERGGGSTIVADIVELRVLQLLIACCGGQNGFRIASIFQWHGVG